MNGTLNIEHRTSNVERRRNDAGARLVFVVGVVASAALLVILAMPVLSGQVYVDDDLGAFHLPARAFYAQCLADGNAFDWWPDLFCGFYLTGEGQAGTYHPLHLALYWCLPLPLAFGLEIWLSYPVMLAGMFVWLRRHLDRGGAMFGALVFTFSGFNLLHFVHVNAIAVVAHIPWLLWMLECVIRGRSPRVRAMAAAGIGLLTGSQILLGYPQYVWFSLLVEAIYAMWLCRVGSAYPKLRLLRILVTAKLLGLLIGAVQWMPTVDALSHSTRADASTEFTANGSLHPLNAVQLVAPYLFKTRVVGQNTHELGMYIGAIPCVLIAWLLANGVRRKRWLTVFAVVTALFAFCMALGDYGPLYWLQSHLPLVGSFRFPARIIVLLHLALAVLAAIAISRLVRGQNTAHVATPSDRAVFLPAAVSLLVTAFAVFRWPEHLAHWTLVLAGPLLVFAATWLVILAQRNCRWAQIALVVFATLDLGMYGSRFSVHSETDFIDEFAESPRQPPGKPVGRVAVNTNAGRWSQLQVGNRITLSGWRRVDGYVGLPPVKRLDYRNREVLRLAGAAWAGELLFQGNDLVEHSFRMIDKPHSEFRFTSRAIANNYAVDSLESVSLANHAIVDRPIVLPDGEPGDVQILRDAPGHIQLATKTPSRQLLVVAQSYHPGWRAKIDGNAAAVWRVYGDFFGCVVPDGEHSVELEFRPESRQKGLLFSAAGLGLLLCGFFATFIQTRKA